MQNTFYLSLRVHECFVLINADFCLNSVALKMHMKQDNYFFNELMHTHGVHHQNSPWWTWGYPETDRSITKHLLVVHMQGSGQNRKQYNAIPLEVAGPTCDHIATPRTPSSAPLSGAQASQGPQDAGLWCWYHHTWTPLDQRYGDPVRW